MITRRRRVLTMALVIMVLVALCPYPAPSRAGPPAPPDRFRWVEGPDDLYPREYGPYLSRPMLTTQSADIPLPNPSFAVDFQHYPTSAEITTFLNQLAAAYPGLLQVTTAGQSSQGRPIHLVRLGNRATGDVDSRPALYVDGQHHAREAIGSEAVLYLLWYLASRYGSDPLVTHLLDTRTVYAIPCVNPDGNDIFLNSDQNQRRTANPTASDDDGDGLYDEDGRDGAGYGTYDVYRYTFDAAWVIQHPSDPFAAGWQAHYLSRSFAGIFDGQGNVIPQVDEDGDGKLSEDPPGGADPNRNYDSHWELGEANSRSDIYRGPAVFSEPETRAVRDFVLARPNIVTALSFHSGSDVLLYPWAWSAAAELPLPDKCWYELLSRKASQLTQANGFRGTSHAWTSRGLYSASGSTIDWLCQQGILAWTPEIYAASSLSFAQRITTTNTYSVGLSVGEAFNPPPAAIPLTVDRWLHWNLYLLAATANVGLSEVAPGDGVLELTIANDGLLPLDVKATVATEQGVYATTITQLSAGFQPWSVPLPPAHGPQVVTVTLMSQSKTGTAPDRLQVEVVKLRIQGKAVHIIEGHLEPFVDEGDLFGGWFAGPEWDTPEYHLGPPLLLESDVAVSKSASPALVARGDVMTYTIQYVSNCSCPATNVYVTDTLPAGTTYGGAVAAPGWTGPNVSGQTVSWYRAALTTGNSGQLVLTATTDLRLAVSPDWVLTNTVQITAAEDVTPANNVSSASTVLQGLQLRQTHLPDKVTATSDFAYYIDLTNTASSPATKIIVTDTLPAWVAPYAVQPSPGGTFDGVRTVTWLIPSLAPGFGQRLWVEVRTTAEAGGQCLTNLAEADSDQRAPPVSATDTTCVRAAPGPAPRSTPTPTPTPPPLPGTALIIQKGTLGDSEDTYIDGHTPNANYGSAPLLKVGNKQTSAALLRFDLSPLPAGATIDSASLELWAVGGSGADMAIGAYAVLRDVTMNQATWNVAQSGNPWAVAGGNDPTADRRATAESTLTAAVNRNWYSFDLTSLVRQWAGGGVTNNGVLLRTDYSTSSLFLASAEYPDVTLRPRLVMRCH